HQRDNDRLINALKEMRDLGNRLIVVEHDEEMMLKSDYLIDDGPRAGVHGGEIVAAGTPEEVMNNPNSLTGQYLSGKLQIPVPERRRRGNGKFLTIVKALEDYLNNITVKIQLGKLTVITGVSGSAKCTLVNQVLYKKLMKKIYRSKIIPGKCDDIL